MLARVSVPLARRALLPGVAFVAPARLTRSLSTVWDGRNADSNTAVPRSQLRTSDQSVDPADVPLKEQSTIKSAALDAASEVALSMSGLPKSVRGKAKRAVNKVAGSIEHMTEEKGGQHRALHTSAASRAIDDENDRSRARSTSNNEDMEDLKDDARRMKEKASNRLSQAGIEMKEKGQEVLHGAKKAGRRLKKAVKGAMDEVVSPPKGASQAIPPEARFSESEAVRNVAHSEVLSTSRPGSSGVGSGVGAVAPDVVEEPVKKSALWDGPQEMPQGVGKRAKDEEGRPMETGTERS
jgi:hypothetical protein